MYKAVAAAVVLLVLCGYLFISRPDKIVINEKGNVAGILNKSRAFIQGDRFWKDQLKLATDFYNKNNSPRLPSSAEMQALYSKVRENQLLLDEKMKVLFTSEEQLARNLREKADSLELSEKWRSIDDAAEVARVSELEKVRIIIPLIELRLHITKPAPEQVTK
jgi:hypothetical protein